ncbi:hypothetical protein R1sor_013164 [Riccia sorocarpa]|uniref:Uncharacterized protein n=1 Tax=Riccia sorocarpa TaxID=122646 RepID=A0ABD3H9C0_9MARC
MDLSDDSLFEPDEDEKQAQWNSYPIGRLENLNEHHFLAENDPFTFMVDRESIPSVQTPLESWQREVDGRTPFSDDVEGRTWEMVKREAARIQLEERFQSFEEFDFSLDCLGVVSGRVAAKIKSKYDCKMLVCVFRITHHLVAGVGRVTWLIYKRSCEKPSIGAVTITRCGAIMSLP